MTIFDQNRSKMMSRKPFDDLCQIFGILLVTYRGGHDIFDFITLKFIFIFFTPGF